MQKPIEKRVAISAMGKATIIDKGNEALLKVYLHKHPYLDDFIKLAECALIQLQVEEYLYIRKFQCVADLR